MPNTLETFLSFCCAVMWFSLERVRAADEASEFQKHGKVYVDRLVFFFFLLPSSAPTLFPSRHAGELLGSCLQRHASFCELDARSS